MKHYLEQSDKVLTELETSADGLSATEAQARLEKNGKNKLAEGKKESLLRRFFKQRHTAGSIFADPAAVQ